MKVELQGESFKMTEERKVMFKPYHPLTFIQTDKPIYIPGQTGELWMFQVKHVIIMQWTAVEA